MADNKINFSEPESAEPRRLRFFRQMIDAEGIRSQTAAELLDVTQVCYNMWLRADTMQLSNVYEMAEKLGYDLLIDIPDPEGVNVDDQFIKNVCVSAYTVGKQSLPNRLFFLLKAMKARDITRPKLAKLTGYPPYKFQYTFTRDDIGMDLLFKCVEAMGANLVISMKKRVAPVPDDNKSKVIFRLDTGEQFNYILHRYPVDDINDKNKRERAEQKREKKRLKELENNNE